MGRIPIAGKAHAGASVVGDKSEGDFGVSRGDGLHIFPSAFSHLFLGFASSGFASKRENISDRMVGLSPTCAVFLLSPFPMEALGVAGAGLWAFSAPCASLCSSTAHIT